MSESYLIKKDDKSIIVNITHELSQMKDIDPLDILDWIYEDLIEFLNSVEDNQHWEVEFNRENAIDGWELIIPSIWETATLQLNE